MNKPQDLEIKRLPPDRWQDYKTLRLNALKNEPTAFGASYEDEVAFSEDEWKKRSSNAIFALVNGKPVGIVVFVFEKGAKTKHIANLFSVYVEPFSRGQGIGKKLLEHALSLISDNKEIVKVKLSVNPRQEAAVKLYGEMGFLVVGQMKKELKIESQFYDELIMEKML
jgi:ribosomal protein S18 acetylase RimI-like enzyme